MKLTTRTSVQVNINLASKSSHAAEAAARIVFPELNSAFQDAIGSKVWSWPRPTIRSDKKDAGNPRNIVDTGILKASNSFNISGTLGTFKWAADYAAAAHYGANIHPWGKKNLPKVSLPPRPWTDAVLGVVQVGGIQPYDYRTQFKLAFVSAFRRLL